MKTTIDIPEEVLEEAIRNTGANGRHHQQILTPRSTGESASADY